MPYPWESPVLFDSENSTGNYYDILKIPLAIFLIHKETAILPSLQFSFLMYKGAGEKSHMTCNASVNRKYINPFHPGQAFHETRMTCDCPLQGAIANE